jgi:regulatory Fis family protein
MGAVATAAVNPFVTETTTELLRTIAGVLDVKSVFPRISNIVQQVVPHDALGLRFRDRTGRATLEARSTDELPEHGWCTNQEEKECTIASDRISDVPLLAEQFLADVGGALSGPPARLSGRARKALLAYGWPGNIRELRNVLESAAILSDEGVIEPHHLSLPAKERPYASPHDLVTIERQTIQNVLRETDWNKAKAARLGLTRQQLYVRMRRYGIVQAAAI